MYATVRLAAAAAGLALVVAILPGPAWLGAVVADGLLLLAFVNDLRSAPRPESLRVTRDVAEVTAVGRQATVALRVHNPARRRVEVIIRDASPASLHRTPMVHRALLSPGEWATLTSEIRPERRGRAVLGPVTLRAAGPLRLGGRQRTLPLETPIKVYPPLPGRAQVELRLGRARLLQSGERSSAIRGGGTEFDSLREYHPDDEFRRINWRATARAGKPISNVYREERNQQVMLLLDAGRLMAGTVARVSRFEHAIDAAVAVAELATRVGDHVGMVAFGRGLVTQIGPKSGRAQSRRILDALFDVSPSLDAPNYSYAFASTLTRYRRRALLVLLTELAGEAVLDALFEAIPALLGRHLVVIGSVVDPALAGAAGAEASNEQQVYGKAAAAAELSARERAAARLRRLGVVVVDAPPGELAGRLADSYLRIKAFGRL